VCGAHETPSRRSVSLGRGREYTTTAGPDTERHRLARHAERVDRIARFLRSTPAGAAPHSFRKRAVSHQVPKNGDKRRYDEKIDVTDLDEILDIDTAARTCTVEPGVTFVDLVATTLRHGLVPTVVPELETITVGGAVSGCSLESMSFRHGGFHDSCLEYEVITTDGVVLSCTPNGEHRLVFEMMHGSFGTLGFLSKIKFRLVPAKPFVHVTYLRRRTLEDARASIRRLSQDDDVDFLDGIFHSPSNHVLCVGRFVDSAPYTNRYDWVTPYYRTTATRREDYFETSDYFFRYDRGVTNPTPRSFLGRLLFGRVLDSATLLRLAERFHRFLPARRPNVTLDLFLPFSRVEAFFEWYHRAIGHYPLWCVPYRLARPYAWIEPSYLEGLDDDLFLDIAIYGLAQPRGRNYYREIEDALPAFKGIKTLISHNYYDEATFWKIWNRPNYERVKGLTDRKNLLRDLHAKTCLAARGL
jgi:FAD/FMN-containing dehydrogenase